MIVLDKTGSFRAAAYQQFLDIKSMARDCVIRLQL